MVDTELVEVVGGGDLEHEGRGRGRLGVAGDPGMLQTLRHAGPVAENIDVYFETRRNWFRLRLCDFKY